MLRHCYRVSVVYLVLSTMCFLVRAGENEPTAKMRVAIADFQSPADAPWLGMAISEAVIAKLANTHGVEFLERHETAALLLKAQARYTVETVADSLADTQQAKLLGCDALLLGSIQRVGKVDDPASTLRITAKLVSVTSGTVTQHEAIVLDGTLGSLFDLETALAKTVSDRLGCQVPKMQLAWHAEISSQVQQLFAEGMVLLSEAEAIVPDVVEAKSGAVQSISSEIREKAIARAAAAADKFREAQELNTGFFSRAHWYESRARDWHARLQAEKAEEQRIREQTVALFRKDAADAAPALFDLGRALEAGGQFAEAITAYGDYLKWLDASQKTVVFRITGKSPILMDVDGNELLVVLEEKQVNDKDGKRMRGYSFNRHDATTGILTERMFSVVSESLFNGLAVGTHTIAIKQTKKTLLFFDRKTGELINTVIIPDDAQIDAYASLFISSDEKSMLLVSRKGSIGMTIASGAIAWKYTDTDATAMRQEYYQPFYKNPCAIDGKTVGLDSSAKYLFTPACDPERQKKSAPCTFLNTNTGEVLSRKTSDACFKDASRRACFPDQTDNLNHYWCADIDRNLLQMRDAKTDELLWSCLNPRLQRLGNCGEQNGFFYYQPNLEEILCIRPNLDARGHATQTDAYRGMGRCQGALKQSCDAMFEKAELIDASDPELYREWAHSLPQTPETAKQRFRILECFLRYITDTDPRWDAVRTELYELSGLRNILYGQVNLIPISDYRVKAYIPDISFCSTAQGTLPLSGYEPATGNMLWRQPRIAKVLANTSIVQTLLPSVRHVPSVIQYGNANIHSTRIGYAGAPMNAYIEQIKLDVTSEAAFNALPQEGRECVFTKWTGERSCNAMIIRDQTTGKELSRYYLRFSLLRAFCHTPKLSLYPMTGYPYQPTKVVGLATPYGVLSGNRTWSSSWADICLRDLHTGAVRWSLSKQLVDRMGTWVANDKFHIMTLSKDLLEITWTCVDLKTAKTEFTRTMPVRDILRQDEYWLRHWRNEFLFRVCVYRNFLYLGAYANKQVLRIDMEHDFEEKVLDLEGNLVCFGVRYNGIPYASIGVIREENRPKDDKTSTSGFFCVNEGMLQSLQEDGTFAKAFFGRTAYSPSQKVPGPKDLETFEWIYFGPENSTEHFVQFMNTIRLYDTAMNTSQHGFRIMRNTTSYDLHTCMQYDKNHDAILITENRYDRTFLFDAKRLREFLRLPGE